MLSFVQVENDTSFNNDIFDKKKNYEFYFPKFNCSEIIN